MPFVIVTFPFFSDYTCKVLDRFLSLPDTRVAVVTHDPEENLAPELRARISGHWRVNDIRDFGALLWAVESLQNRVGEKACTVLSPAEHCQISAAQIREHLGLGGMSLETTLNFRDKVRMKDLFDAAGVPCARHRRALADADFWSFAHDVGFPFVAKPVDGAASQATLKISDWDNLRAALQQLRPAPHNQYVLEEFLRGEEHSIDAFWHRGKRVFHTVNNYFPSCLDVMQTPWVQWVVILPRERDDTGFDDIREVSLKAHAALGMGSGMSHTEWFRRTDGTVAISEIGARPPGAQFTTLISRAGDFDAIQTWAKLMVFDDITPPEGVKYAAGAAYLRGQGYGAHVRAIHGWDEVRREIGALITDFKLPSIGAEKSVTYEGEGFLIARHAETRLVEEALKWAVSVIRVELG